jgi:hypothetical protein
LAIFRKTEILPKLPSVNVAKEYCNASLFELLGEQRS